MSNDLFADLEAQAQEFSEERAAVREFDAGFTREEATRLGVLDSRVWLTACLVRFAMGMADRQCVEWVLDLRMHQGEDAMAQLVAGLEPFSRRELIVKEIGLVHGQAAADALITRLKKIREARKCSN